MKKEMFLHVPRFSSFLLITICCFTLLGLHAAASDPVPVPGVKVVSVSSNKVPVYDKFEILLELKEVQVDNPYDPEDIDVYAEFLSPSGKSIRINAFYDNYQDMDQWKLRFSPGETGKYSYRLFVSDNGTMGKGVKGSFSAIASEHHGWIRPSKVNLHYFSYDDGSSFYGVGVYSPWRNDMDRIQTYIDHGANLFAIWDIMYGGFVNGTGLLEEELGRYNQLKMGRIDSLLHIFEQNDIQLMYAIWPHDLFSASVWAARWEDNPYKQLCSAEEVYSNPEAWKYQQQKYRYMIARFSHSRSMGIWELINEMNGTDGWEQGRYDECFEWVDKCQKYFEENDPYRHPVTASFSGGFNEYRERLYEITDIPNIHIYPSQGWKKKYPENTMRSAMYNYAWASRRFWDAFEKPAIFGEAGANLAYYSPDKKNYHVAYHQQIWACLTNGLAATPVWWDYTELWEEDWDQLQVLAAFVSDVDFANKAFEPMEVHAPGMDCYVLGTGSEAIGWGRSIECKSISGMIVSVSGMVTGSYRAEWIDPWTGKIVEIVHVEAVGEVLTITIPELQVIRGDLAFKVYPL